MTYISSLSAAPKESRRGISLIPRNTLVTLMLAFCFAVAPHLLNVTNWLSVLAPCMLVWRYGVFKGVVDFPSAKFKTLLVIVSVALFYFTYRYQFSVDSAVAFFVLASSLKLIEIRFVKDCYLFVFILLYLSATQFLFSQTFMTTLYQCVSLFVALSVLFTLHKGQIDVSFSSRVKSLFKMSLIAIPLVCVIFMFFPRVAPLWSIPLSTGKAVSGMTDSMSPGRIAELTQSSARAFRVDFSGNIPAKNTLYWRGLELDRLDGETWSSSEYLAERLLGRVDRGRDLTLNMPDSYDILLEPTNKRWAYALEGSIPGTTNIELNNSSFVRLTSNAIQPTRYRMGWHPQVIEQTEKVPDSLDVAALKKYLQLPKGGNAETRTFVNGLIREGLSEEGLIDYLMNYFRAQPFHYTLRPPLTGDQFFDDFLFSTQRGFCSHYAGSLVYMLRLANIPSRVVVGYQGGEINSDEGYLIIHQYDAHAWIEAWLPDKGWARYDPTAMVSPDRIEQGLEEAMLEEGSFLSDSTLAFAKYNHISVIRWMRLKMDAVNYNWQKWVVGYDRRSQAQILSKWLGDVSFQSLAIWMSLTAGGILFVAFFVFRGRNKTVETDKVVIEFNRFCRKLERVGLKRGSGETPQQFTERLIDMFPEMQGQLRNYIRFLYLVQYGRGMNNLNQKKKLIKNLKQQANRIVSDVRLRSKRSIG